MLSLDRRSLLAVCLTLVLGGAAAPAAGPPAPSRVDELEDSIDALVAEALEAPGAVGFSVAVGWGDRILLAKGYGLAEVEHGVEADADTVFRIGSVTKQFTAAAIMKLVEEGEVELDANMNAYLPDYPTQGHVVTVRHLLTHTSGIVSYTGVPEMAEQMTLELTHEQLLSRVIDEPFQFAPGERWRYNNTGYYLLGMIVEEVTDESYADYLQAQILKPIGSTRIRYGSNVAIIENRAQGYRLVDGELANDGLIGMSQPGAAGALIGSARDLVVWQTALVGGKVVTPGSYTAMATPATLKDGSPTGYGFGLMNGAYEGHARVQHGGGINGFNSVLAYYPEEELSVAVISNSEAARSQDLADRIAGSVLGL